VGVATHLVKFESISPIHTEIPHVFAPKLAFGILPRECLRGYRQVLLRPLGSTREPGRPSIYVEKDAPRGLEKMPPGSQLGKWLPLGVKLVEDAPRGLENDAPGVGGQVGKRLPLATKIRNVLCGRPGRVKRLPLANIQLFWTVA
jgi:hypothetical protein